MTNPVHELNTHTHTHKHIHIYIYIYGHPQTDCFIVSQISVWLDVSWQVQNPANFTSVGYLTAEQWSFTAKVKEFLTYAFFTYTLSATWSTQFIREAIVFRKPENSQLKCSIHGGGSIYLICE